MQTIVNLDVPERNVTFLKISRAKYIKDYEGTSFSFVKNKANSCKLSLKRTRKFINSLHNVNRINNMLLDVSTYEEFHLDI